MIIDSIDCAGETLAHKVMDENVIRAVGCQDFVCLGANRSNGVAHKGGSYNNDGPSRTNYSDEWCFFF